MRSAWLIFCLVVATAAGPAVVAGADDPGTTDPGPSLEYRPPRPVQPEPKAPTPAPPIPVFRESFGGFGISTGAFDEPVDVAFDADGNIYVLDAGNSRVQMFDRFSKYVLEWGGSGSRPGEFKRPGAIAIGPGGYIYVVDTGNDRVQQFGWVSRSECAECPARSDGQRLKLISSWGSLGSRSGEPGSATSTMFKSPLDITFEGEELIWVLDAGNERVQQFKFDRRTMHGRSPTFEREIGRVAGSRGGEFADQVSIAWSDERFGYLYLLGRGCLVQQFAGDGRLERTWPAVAPESGLCVPARIKSDNRGRYLYVLDAGNGLIARYHREGRFLSEIRGAERPFAGPQGFDLRPGSDEFVVADTGNNLVQKFTLR